MKSISKIIVIILILLIIIALILMLWVFSSTLFTSITSTGKVMIENVKIRKCLFLENINSRNMEISLRNCGQATITAADLEFYIQDTSLKCFGIEDIEPYKVKSCRLSECLPYGKKTLKITGYNLEMEKLIDFPIMYCINASARSSLESGKSYLIIEGNVYRNDEAKTPYKNRDIEYNLSQIDTEYVSPNMIASTDNQGKFQIKKEWNYSYLLPKQWWEVPYEYEMETENLWDGSAYIPQSTQPEWPVRFQDIYVTQSNPVLFKLESQSSKDVWQSVLINKDIKPVEITADNVTFNVSFEVNIKSPVQPANTETWFGTSLYNYVTTKIQCFDTSFASCLASSGNIVIDNWASEDQVFNGDIPFEINVSNPNSKPLLADAWQQLSIYKYYNGDWRFLYTSYNNKYFKLNPGEKRLVSNTIWISDIKSWLQKRFPGSITNGTYMIYISSNFPEWGNSYAVKYFRFFINDSSQQFAKKTGWSSSVYNVIWNFSTALNPGIYNFSFLVTHPRDSALTVQYSNDLLAFVNKGDNLISKRYDMWSTSASFTGLREPGAMLYIPIKTANLPDSFQLYTSAQVLSVEKLTGKYKLRIKATSYLLNFGNTNIDKVTIFKRRGTLFTRGPDYLNESGKVCQGKYLLQSVENIAPGEGEVRSNWLFYEIGSSGSEFLTPNITVNINDNYFNTHDYYTGKNVSCNGGISCRYQYNGWLVWTDVTNYVGNSPFFNVSFIGNGGCGTSGTIVSNPWIKFTNVEALWQNRATNLASFRTIDNEEGVAEGYYEYTFET
jgi:hypothetical protein